jgi:hypothetical protein
VAGHRLAPKLNGVTRTSSELVVGMLESVAIP